MRLTFVALGWTLDWSLEPTTIDADEADDDGAALNGGTLASQPMGFVARMEVPEEVTAPQHCPSWDEPEERA